MRLSLVYNATVPRRLVRQLLFLCGVGGGGASGIVAVRSIVLSKGSKCRALRELRASCFSTCPKESNLHQIVHVYF